MKVFLSSLITGMEPIRAAARAAVQTLGHEPVMAEDFGALPHSPQVACLDGVRRSASVVLILGARYGAKQASGLSATHEEYREAREHRPVLAFIQEPMDPEPDQAAFIREVQGWMGGLIRAGFTDSADLQAKVTRALHRLELANATAPFDSAGVLARALACPSRPISGKAIMAASCRSSWRVARIRPSCGRAKSSARRLPRSWSGRRCSVAPASSRAETPPARMSSTAGWSWRKAAGAGVPWSSMRKAAF
jgi:hypothetical protein